MTGPADGLRVLELDPSPAVAMAGWLLAQMGADVRLLEPPGGCRLRQEPPFADDRSALFAYLAANTTGGPLPAEDEALPVAGVHVVLHARRDLPPRWVESVTGAPLPDRGRAVVACTPYGQEGPRRDWDASELVLFQAGGEGYLMPSGLGFEQFPDRPPIGIGRHLASYQGGLSAGIAALAGLLTSRRAGVTEWADVSIQDIEVSLNYFTVSRLVEGVREARSNRAFKYGGVLRCRDGYVELVTLEQGQWESLGAMLGDPEWAWQPHLQDALDRGRHGAEVNRHLRAWAAERTVSDVARLAARHGVPCGPYVALEDLVGDPQLVAREFFVEAGPQEGTGAVFPGTPWRLSSWPSVPHTAAPAVPVERGGPE